ncbi:MAG: AAA family ATPase, partial [Sedimenticolaceae bacterium]
MPAKSDLTTTQLAAYLSENFGNDIFANDVRSACEHFGVTYATATKRLRDFYVCRGTWNLTVQERLEQTYQAPAAAPAIQVTDREDQNLVPDKDANFVPFGNFSDVKKIIKSGLFYPVFITGMSGNGKTFSVDQACATLNRELVRVNITIETDEDDLIGGFRLVNGETVWHNGPVIEALERGAVLLLDEVDLASNKILCLQSILEGKG